MNREHPENRNRLSWWFPKLPNHILTPETLIIPYTGRDLLNILDGKVVMDFVPLCTEIINAGDEFGWPLFLRTDYLSGKHNWKLTCYVSCREFVQNHVINLIEESVMADVMGFPTDQWIVRKMIPTEPRFRAFRGDMPIVKERRYFVQDEQVVCHHPYWPPSSFVDQETSVVHWPHRVFDMNIEPDYEVRWLSQLSSQVGAAIGGAWSIDWLWSDDEYQWYLIDMAEADQSYHWSGCLAKKGKL